ncbi:MAG: AAC(3) family N-acetyltransferase [Lachnospiraceae bacterium]|nr:AAC(3) family N-acetyltransferase [Lachnospiraceae bacterium]
MYRKEDLKAALKAMEIKQNDVLMLHSSMKSIGEVLDGADTVVDAFMEYLEEGLFLTPTHTWKQMSEQYNIFDPATEPACVGIIPNIFMKKEGVVRSLHPTHSVAAYGKNAAEYVKGDDEFNTPCNPKGCFGRLLDMNAKILLVGVTHARNTFIHAIEEMLDVEERFTEKPTLFNVKLPEGTLKEFSMYRHYNKHMAHISESFDKLMDAYFEAGAAKWVSFGDAKCILCDAKGLYEVTKSAIEKDEHTFI